MSLPHRLSAASNGSPMPPDGAASRDTQDPALSPRSSLDSSRSPSLPPSVSVSNPISVPGASASRLPPPPPPPPSAAESLRLGAVAASPRSRMARPPSLTQAALQSLIEKPAPRPADPRFAGRDWTQIALGELVMPGDVRFAEVDTGIEEATKLLIESDIRVLLIRENKETSAAVDTFDFADLNAYLLLVVGQLLPDEEHVGVFEEMAHKAKAGEKIPIRDVKALLTKGPITTLPESIDLRSAVETFGSGVQRIVVVKENNKEVIGIVSQLRLVKFLWENGQSFPVIEHLYLQTLADLRVGSPVVISINGDKPLLEALTVMNIEGIPSIAVVDNHSNAVGNISVVDVQLLTTSSSLPLLYDTCIHFISVVLSNRGLTDGKDSYPIFNVNPIATLSHTVAKILATKAHRMWITDPQSPISSTPSTPSLSAVHVAHIPEATPPGDISLSPTPSHAQTVPPIDSGNLPPRSVSPAVGLGVAAAHTPQLHRQYSSSAVSTAGGASSAATTNTTTTTANTSTEPSLSPLPQPATLPIHPPPFNATTTTTAPIPPPPMSSSIPATALPGSRLGGRLIGVVSLTDVLNLYARASGLRPADPNGPGAPSARRGSLQLPGIPVGVARRRRSSTSSSVSAGLSVRRSLDVARGGEAAGGR